MNPVIDATNNPEKLKILRKACRFGRLNAQKTVEKGFNRSFFVDFREMKIAKSIKQL